MPDTNKKKQPKPLALGWEEWIALPSLKIAGIRAKIDTGLTTSSLHVSYVEPYKSKAGLRVRFSVEPFPKHPDISLLCTAKVIDERDVTLSSGAIERRYVIETKIKIGTQKWPIEIMLSNREDMAHRFVLGRSALPADTTINSTKSFLHNQFDVQDYINNTSLKERPFTPLKIGILSESEGIYSTRRLIETARQRGHTAELIRSSVSYMNISQTSGSVFYEQKPCDRFDAIIPRVSTSLTFYGTAIVRQFETLGTYCVNSARAITASRDKLYAHQVMAMNNLPMPKTAVTKSSAHIADVIKSVGGAPLVVKLLESAQGNGVILAETNQAAESVISALQGLNANIIVQEFIKESKGTDIRCFVVGNKVIASMKRTAKHGEFRSNIHKGGSGSKIKITAEERKIAVKAAKSLGLKVAGVDILRSDSGPKVLEVNSSPGLEGIEAVTGIDVAGKIIDYIEKHTGTVLARKTKRV